VHGAGDPVAWLVRVTAYVYASFYTALDVVNGIAAGWVTHQLGPGVPRPREVSLLFQVGTPLGRIGSVALIVCCLLVTARAVRRERAWGALLLVPGAVLVHIGHIFAPPGVVGMVLLGIGTFLAASRARPTTLTASGAS
jgi:hypothetical protein